MGMWNGAVPGAEPGPGYGHGHGQAHDQHQDQGRAPWHPYPASQPQPSQPSPLSSPSSQQAQPSQPPPAPQGGHAAPGAWQAPSRVEGALYEAKMRGDWATYFHALAGTRLYHAMPRDRADASPGKVSLTPYRNPVTGTDCLAVFTWGMLPAPVPDPVFFSGTLGWWARTWTENDPPWLAVNPGTPCEAFFPTTPADRALWHQHADRVPECGTGPHQLHTLWVGAPLQGPVAHGLACGALLSVKNGDLWNAMAYHGSGYGNERDRLKEWWGVTSREEWQRTQELLLEGEMSSAVWDFALGVRRSLALDFAGAVDVEAWRQITERVLRQRTSEAECRITSDGVTKGETRGDAETEAQITGVQRLIGRIARYEARFRADGLLPDEGFVRSVEAWDYGRAAGMALWGLGARFCTLEEAEQAVTRAGRVSSTNYRSWEDFSAAYILGRCLHFDEEEFGDWYEDMLQAHRLLTTDQDSPWRNIPWT